MIICTDWVQDIELHKYGSLTEKTKHKLKLHNKTSYHNSFVKLSYKQTSLLSCILLSKY